MRFRKPEYGRFRSCVFENTARRVKAVNLASSAMRGGIRLS